MGKKFATPYPYSRDINSQNTRCELAEGVAFDGDLDLTAEQRSAVCEMIHDYVKYIFGEETHS